MKFWRNKKVLVTGSSGFLGSYLVEALKKRGAEVFGLDIKTKGEDVRDYDLVKNVILANKIQVVFHLAAEAIVGRAVENPREAFSTNIIGTWNVLEACRLSHYIDTVIVASSDKAYGEHIKLPYKEDFDLLASYPYDVSKSCADDITRSYFSTYGLPVAITRCGNIYGYGDFNYSRIIPNSIRALLNHQKVILYDNGNFVRDYVYIDDVVDGYIKIAEQMQRKKLMGEVFNFSAENPITGIDLIELINDIVNGQLIYEKSSILKCEIKKQHLSSDKARRVLGWKPRINLKEGLERTIKWSLQKERNKIEYHCRKRNLLHSPR